MQSAATVSKRDFLSDSFLSETNAPAVPGWLPVAGDWNHSGHAGIGVFDPSTQTWYLRNEPDAGAPDAGVFRYGVAGSIPVVGDWTGTGHLGIGVFDPQTFTWYLRSSATPGAPDVGVFQYGGAGWWPVAGDWAGAAHAGIGGYDPSAAMWYLRREPNAGAPDAGQFAYGGAGRLQVVGVFPAAEHLDAAGGEGPGGDPLGQDQLQAAVFGALARLSAAGVDPGLLVSLASASYGVGALPPGVLGLTDVAARRVTLSADAAGHGWFADGTPLQDEEFAPDSPGSPLVALPGSPAAGKEDLLTAVLHEMGHLAGRPDGGAGLMAGALAPGTRDLGALDQVFAALGTGADQLSATLTGLAPRLGALRDNGGPTPALGPLAGSPVIDAGATAAVPTDPNQPFVALAFDVLLGRDAQAIDLAVWRSLLDLGLSPFLFVQFIETTPEFFPYQVDLLFEQELHRPADPASLSASLSFLSQGGTLQELAVFLASTPEYFRARAS
jgi:hypothetical protein